MHLLPGVRHDMTCSICDRELCLRMGTARTCSFVSAECSAYLPYWLSIAFSRSDIVFVFAGVVCFGAKGEPALGAVILGCILPIIPAPPDMPMPPGLPIPDIPMLDIPMPEPNPIPIPPGLFMPMPGRLIPIMPGIPIPIP